MTVVTLADIEFIDACLVARRIFLERTNRRHLAEHVQPLREPEVETRIAAVRVWWSTPLGCRKFDRCASRS